MAVLDLLARDPRVTRVTLVEPDVYKPHNVHRHLFPPSAVGRLKAELAAEWVRERRPDLAFETARRRPHRPGAAGRRSSSSRPACDVGVCAVDNEPAKFAFDALMRQAGKPWTLGEVLSGGIGGWVHRFTPGGPCYGCVASHLQRNVTEEPRGPRPGLRRTPAARWPRRPSPRARRASRSSPALHAVVTLELLASGGREPVSTGRRKRTGGSRPPLARTPTSPACCSPCSGCRACSTRRSGRTGSASRSPPACLICAAVPAPAAGEDLDVALDQALARLGHE